HPLNQARLSPNGRRVIRGYTIIQPSVSASLPSGRATWFSRIFADPRGIDPYTHAVSDVYQDLVGEGSYHGKGIYELQTFHRLLSERFPTAHLLSHDLLEGSYVRVGLATDIELLDVFPSSYIAWWNRQHRWIRGDWQIIDWLKQRVPVGAGRVEPNPLSAFNRWKIFDNLRRSLVPPATVALLLAGWLFTLAPLLWSVLLFAAAAWRGPTAMVAVGPFLLLSALFPVAVMAIDRPAKSWRGGTLTANDRRFLGTAARRTWRYFDDFVGPQTSWLPPDNVQETPKREIFLRTSPTNIGLWMLATVAANDFGYITIDDLVARNLGTLETLGKLERFEGHLFNWYDLSTLEPLHPRYISTVDSGNLLASLWTFESSCDELAARPLLDAGALH